MKAVFILYSVKCVIALCLKKGTWVLVTQLHPTFSNRMDCSSPGSFVLGILQARILEWVAIPCSRGLCRPRDQTQVSCMVGRFFTGWVTREVIYLNLNIMLLEKWHRWICSMQGCHRLSICRKIQYLWCAVKHGVPVLNENHTENT